MENYFENRLTGNDARVCDPHKVGGAQEKWAWLTKIPREKWVGLKTVKTVKTVSEYLG